MAFLGVYTAVYDYQPQGEGELEIHEGDLLYILEKSTEDDWWRAKKKAEREDEDEPEGLVPNNYVEEAQPIHTAKALYDYTRQTDEEVSFSEDAELVVYDTSDPDWTLVGVNDEYGFAPANYIEIIEDSTAHAAPAAPAVPAAPASPAVPALPQRSEVEPEPEEQAPPTPSSPAAQGPAAAIAGILHRQHGSVSSADTPRDVPPPPQPPRPVYVPDEPVEEAAPSPPLPQRPTSQRISPPRQPYSPSEPSPPARTHSSAVRQRERDGGIQESPPFNRVGEATPRSPSGYHIYNVNEMVEAMGKRKKMPTTLGINMATGTIFISPDYDDGPHQEWTADKLSHYSIEGKHVFMDLVRPSKSVDFHAGAKDTAREIVSALGEIAGAYRAEGLKEVIAAGKGGPAQKKGQVLYDFMAQGDDEVTVATGDEVVILDDTKSDEWWMVRRVKNGREGVVPSSYIEITGFVSVPTTGVNAGLSTVEQNRLEEARMTKEAARKSRLDSNDSRMSEVGPGIKVPQRRGSLLALSNNNPSQRKRESKADRGSTSKPKPDPSKTRSWTDRTGSFTVEAQFLALQDGKIHLHKQNGVKIAVPVAKMSVEDLEYVEKVTGQSLDEDKPLSDIRRRNTATERPKDPSRAGAAVNQHDWFDFFLKAGVGPHQCERYSQNFNRDSIDESVLPDITPETLRTLGLKEGDILRVMRYLDNMYGRTGAKSKLRNVSFGGEEVIDGEGGLFSGPGGALRNNTRKGRPAPPVQTSDVVDPKAFEQKDTSTPAESQQVTSASDEPVKKGFDDDAWEVKPPKQPATPAAPASTSTPASPATTQAPQQQPSLTGAMADLTLLQAPLQPTPAQPAQNIQPTITQPPLQPQPTAVQQPPAAPVQPQPTGANPSFFAQLAPQATGLAPQATGFQQMPARQRPQPPQNVGQSSLIPPPPQRPLSAPQNFQAQSAFGPPPLQPQLTGIPQNAPHIAPAGQSLSELNQQRFQQPLQSQPTGFGPQGQFQNGLMPQPTGFQPQSQFGIQQQQQPQFMNAQPTASPFADPVPRPFQSLAPQPTGFGGFPQQQQPMPTGGINSVLPPPLQPQPTGLNGFGNSTFTPPPVPPIPQQPTAAPLQPQKTGPPPPVRFGVKPEAKKLTPQPTGMRANLAQATPSNPFGF
ncbi:cytoskeletal protein binding protein [Paecilomyces lecythidis]|uniref:Actin cytoskeleton-regulatory complex protein SLA1 n=1 Tax=Paecilomyces lecythidis TaxID=3004212 RepID=A0ABR3Y0E5_9EURO